MIAQYINRLRKFSEAGSLRIIVGALAVFQSSVFSLVSRAETLPTETPLEQFKQFTSSPQLIDAVVFRTIVAGNPSNSLPEIGGVISNATVKYYLGRWQPDCFFVKSGTNSNIDDPGLPLRAEISARFHTDYWKLLPSGIVTTWVDTAKTMDEVQMKPSKVFHNRVHQFRELMNMGVMHVEVGALKWNRDDFTATGYVPEWNTTIHITGKVSTDAEGRAREMAVDYNSREAAYTYILRYSYHTNIGLAFLPDTIESFFVLQGVKQKIAEYDILSIKSGNKPIAREAFDLSLYNSNERESIKRVTTIQFTNNHYYAKNIVGGWAPIQTRDGDVSAFNKVTLRQDFSNFYLCVAVASTAIALSSMWRITNKNKKQTKHSHL